MKLSIKLFALTLLLSALVISCGESGPKPVAIESLENYTDASTKFAISYPKNWVVNSQVGNRLNVYSHNKVRARFAKYDPKGFPGAKIDVVAFKADSLHTLDLVAEGAKMFPANLYKESAVTLDGVNAKKFEYTFELDGGKFNGEMYVAQKDPNYITLVRFEAFDGTWEQYKGKFAEMLNTVKLAVTPSEIKRDTVFQTVEAEPPSQTLAERSGDGFSIQIPDNFKAENIGKSAGALRVSNFMGARRGDCYIRIETFDASKQKDLKKIVEENKAKFGGVGAAETSLGGAKAFVLNYKPSGTVKGKVWFAIKNDKLYRVTINWFTGEEKDFLPIFEKSVSTFKFQ